MANEIVEMIDRFNKEIDFERDIEVKDIFSLNIPDMYNRMDPRLIQLIKERVAELF